METLALKTRYVEIHDMSKNIARFASSFVKIHEERQKAIPLLAKDVYHEKANKTLARCAHQEQRLLALAKRQITHAGERLHEVITQVPQIIQKDPNFDIHKKEELKELVETAHKIIEFFEDIEKFFEYSEFRLEKELEFLETASKKDFVSFKRAWRKELSRLKIILREESLMPTIEVKLARTAKIVGLGSLVAAGVFFKYMLETNPVVMAEQGDKFILLLASIGAFGAGIFYLVKGFSADSGEGVYANEIHAEAKVLSHEKARKKREEIKKSKQKKEK